MEHWWYCLFLAAAVVLLSGPRTCSAKYRVYICRSELQSYYENTEYADTVRGHHVDIIRRGQDLTLMDGSLQLTYGNSSVEGSGHSSTTGLLLPPLPPTVDEIRISWHAGEEVNYELQVRQDPDGIFEEPTLKINETGTIPRNRNAFSITFPCTSSDVGRLELNLTATPSSANSSTISVSFYLEKNCTTHTASTPLLSSTPVAASSSLIPASAFGRVQSTPLSSPAASTPLLSQPPTATSSSLIPTPVLSRVLPSLEPTPSMLATPLFSPVTSLTMESTLVPSSSEGITPMDSAEIGSGDVSAFAEGTTVVMAMTSLACGSDLGRLQPFCISSTVTSPSQSPQPSTSVEVTPTPTPTPLEAPDTSSISPSSSIALLTTTQTSSSLKVTFVFSTMEVVSTPVVVSSPGVRVTPSPGVELTPTPSALLSSSVTSSAPISVSSSVADVISGIGFTPIPSSSVVAESSPIAEFISSPVRSTPVPSSVLITSSASMTSRISAPGQVTSSPELELTPVPSALLTTSIVLSSSIAVTSLPGQVTSSPELEQTPVPSALLTTSTVLSSSIAVTSPPAQVTSSPGMEITSVPSALPTSRPRSSPVIGEITSVMESGTTVDGSIAVSVPPEATSASPSVEAIHTTPVVPLPPEVATTTSLPVEASPSETPTVGGTATMEEQELLPLLVIVFAPVAGVLLICIALLFCCICCCVCVKRRRKKKKFNDDPLDVVQTVFPGDEEEGLKKETPISLWMPLTWGAVQGLPQPIRAMIRHFMVDRRSLTLLSTMVRGEYGCIANGQLNIDRTDVMGGNRGVLMKMLIGLKEGSPRDEVVRFVEQATVLRGLDHPNLQPVLRVSVEDNIVPLVIYPIVEYGNMHSFLHHCRITPEESPLNPMTNQWKVNFSLQIAVAMKFLSDNRVVHHDLALRNCLLDTNYTVKVSDGALSPDFYPECYQAVYGSIRPVRWAAIETLQEGLCTSRSNVWSFGVTVWEIMTLADLPYPEVDNNRSILTHLMMDSRLAPPEGCPENLYSLMSDCWRKRGEERPNFTTVLSRLEEMYSRYAAVQAMDDRFTPSPQVRTSDDLSFSTFGKNLAVTQSQRSSAGTDAEVASAGGVVARRNRGPGGGYHRSSQGSRTSRHRDSQRDEKLSITFSVLSGDVLGSGPVSGSDSEGEDEPRLSSAALILEPLPLSLAEEPLLEASDSSHLTTPSLLNPQSSYSETTPYLNLPSTFLSPHSDASALLTPPAKFGTGSSSTLQDVSSYPSHQGRSGERHEDSSSTILPLTTSPSPDIMSKTSTIGDETMSTTSFSVSAVPTSTSSQVNADTVSKTSTLDLESVSTTVSGPASQASHSLPGHYSNYNGATNEQKSRNRSPLLFDHSPRTNGSTSLSPQGRASKSTDSGIRSDEEADGPPVMDAEGTSAQPNSAAFTSPKREGNADAGQSATSRNSRTSQSSFGVGISDLSSEFMSAFDTWDLGNK